ncbi:MAG: hypothetical protein QNJ70_18525 [Xenococcaceae cyanobacterium MO_207.B15]|nr:hypothetical protein [Xenococcaceae cyanobacterium MO_207.B15]
MANLSEEILTTIFNLQKQLFKIINEATATDYNLIEQYGETSATLPELEELQNIRERARDAYTRLFRLLLNIGETQPVINPSTLELLYKAIEQADLTVNVLEVSIKEIKNNWNLS